MGTPSDVSRRASEMLGEFGHWDTVLNQLRTEGFSQAQAIRATVECLGVSLAEAKKVIHGSAEWADVRLQNDSFHYALGQAADAAL